MEMTASEMLIHRVLNIPVSGEDRHLIEALVEEYRAQVKCSLRLEQHIHDLVKARENA